jgi:hypothetical protein
MASPRSASSADKTSLLETTERAARIAAMLDRWNAEDVSKEPDWSVADLEPITLRHSTGREATSVRPVLDTGGSPESTATIGIAR